jgi:hypothetical protein
MSTILAVVIGWLLGVAGQLLKWIWSRREVARESHEVLRRTARLIADDLAGGEHRLKGILDGSILWREVGFPVTDWLRAREVFVTALSKEEWESVTEAYRALTELNAMTAYRSEEDQARLKAVAASSLLIVQKAIRALSRASA